MDEHFPDKHTKTLPEHVTVTTNGDRKAHMCTGREVNEIFSDVGLWYGHCPVCRETFVYIVKTNSWMVESEFEKALRDAPPELQGLGN